MAQDIQPNYFVSTTSYYNQRRPITSYPGWSVTLVDKETVKSWRIGKQLSYALLIEAQHPGHEDGIPTFLSLMDELSKHIMDEESITTEDTQRIFDVIVIENKTQLMRKVLNHPLLPNSKYDGSIATVSLKQAIRLNSFDVLNLMIKENVTILSEDMNNFDDIKSLIFNILRCVEIDTNHESLITANLFWQYLAKCFYESYHPQNDDRDHLHALQCRTKVVAMSYDKSMQYLKYFVRNPQIRYAIYKKIHASSTGKHYINKLLPIIRFLCEHFVIFDDNETLSALHSQCVTDELLDASNLIRFNIRADNGEMIELFWSKYLAMKLIDDYLGMNVLSKYRKIKQNERDKMLDVIQYLISNGVGAHAEDVIIAQMKTEKYVKHKDSQNVWNAIGYGQNIWNVKQLQKNEILSLFSKVKVIQMPYSLCAFILSFVVLP
eukprot:353144_1